MQAKNHDFRRQWNATCAAAGLNPISFDTAARVLAVVYAFDREEMTHCGKLRADLDHIQDVYGIRGGMTPDREFCAEFARRVLDIERNGGEPTEWAVGLMREMYGIDL